MTEIEKQNREYADRIDLKSELGEIIYNYKKEHGKNTKLLIERRKRTKKLWQLVEVDTNNILWKENEKAMLGGIAKLFLIDVERRITAMIKNIDTNRNENIELEVEQDE